MVTVLLRKRCCFPEDATQPSAYILTIEQRFRMFCQYFVNRVERSVHDDNFFGSHGSTNPLFYCDRRWDKFKRIKVSWQWIRRLLRTLKIFCDLLGHL